MSEHDDLPELPDLPEIPDDLSGLVIPDDLSSLDELSVPDDLSALDALRQEGSEGAGPALGDGRASEPSPQVELPRAVKRAIVCTPMKDAQATAMICQAVGVSTTLAPTSSGVIAVQTFTSAHSEWDISELLDGMDSEPAEASALAASLSLLTRYGCVLLCADLATDVGIDTGLSGTISARMYVNGRPMEELSSGAFLGNTDPVIEDLLVGLADVEDIDGVIHTDEVEMRGPMAWMARRAASHARSHIADLQQQYQQGQRPAPHSGAEDAQTSAESLESADTVDPHEDGEQTR